MSVRKGRKRAERARGSNRDGAKGTRERRRESAKPHAYKWYANKIHLSMVVCGPALVGAQDAVEKGNGVSVDHPHW